MFAPLVGRRAFKTPRTLHDRIRRARDLSGWMTPKTFSPSSLPRFVSVIVGVPSTPVFSIRSDAQRVVSASENRRPESTPVRMRTHEWPGSGTREAAGRTVAAFT